MGKDRIKKAYQKQPQEMGRANCPISSGSRNGSGSSGAEWGTGVPSFFQCQPTASTPEHQCQPVPSLRLALQCPVSVLWAATDMNRASLPSQCLWTCLHRGRRSHASIMPAARAGVGRYARHFKIRYSVFYSVFGRYSVFYSVFGIRYSVFGMRASYSCELLCRRGPR